MVELIKARATSKSQRSSSNRKWNNFFQLLNPKLSFRSRTGSPASDITHSASTNISSNHSNSTVGSVIPSHYSLNSKVSEKNFTDSPNLEVFSPDFQQCYYNQSSAQSIKSIDSSRNKDEEEEPSQPELKDFSGSVLLNDHLECFLQQKRKILVESLNFYPVPIHYKLIGTGFLNTDGNVHYTDGIMDTKKIQSLIIDIVEAGFNLFKIKGSDGQSADQIVVFNSNIHFCIMVKGKEISVLCLTSLTLDIFNDQNEKFDNNDLQI